MKIFKVAVIALISLILTAIAIMALFSGCSNWEQDGGTRTLGVITRKAILVKARDRYRISYDTTYIFSIYIKERDELMKLAVDKKSYEAVTEGDSIETLIVNHYQKQNK